MVFRIFIVVLAFAAAALVYDSARLVILKNTLHKVDDAYAVGSVDAELRVVEFLDYSCHKCQKTNPALKEALRQTGEVRFVPRPITSETEGGNLAGQFAYAAARQGKFIDAHNVLIENYRTVDHDYLEQIANELGLDYAQIKHDMDDPKIARQLEKNKDYNKNLRAITTPAFLINSKIMWFITDPIPTVQDFLNVFEEARQ